MSQQNLANFAVDVASALHYLSGHSLVHRDVAARNVLGRVLELTNGSVCGTYMYIRIFHVYMWFFVSDD